VLLLVHGMGGGYENWREVIEPLARRRTVVAPDLPGHGASPPGNGDYSIGALAAGLRDLLLALGHERATLVGHSLGELGELVGELHRDSAAALPGSELWITATARTASWAGAAVGRGLSRVGLRPTPDVAEVARGYASLTDPGRRAAFLATLRSVINVAGQRIDATDRLYLTEGLPVLIVWGERDPIIPVSHGERAHDAVAGSRLEIFDGVGHLPQLEAPARFVAVLERFLEQTAPARFDAREWRTRFQTTTDELQRARTSRKAAG